MNKMLLGLSTLAVAGSLQATVAEHVSGEIIVKFKAGREKSFFQNKSASSLGIQGHRDIKLTYGKLSVLKVEDKASIESVIATLNKNPDIEYAEPNFIYRVNPIKEHSSSMKRVPHSPFTDFTAPTPDDPSFGQLWGLRNTGSNEPQGAAGIEGSDVNALKAWDLTKGSKAVKIAVIDTGVDYNHPDLLKLMDKQE
jgi:subtilisin family serine protease